MSGSEWSYDQVLRGDPRACAARPWDAVIIGAGPAGSVCARQLAHSGHNVLVIDKERFPRHKVCGDLLVPDALAMLRRVDLHARIAALAHASRTIEVASPSGIRFAVPGEYLALSRKRLDYELCRHAAAAGAHVLAGNAAGVEPAAGDGLVRVHLSGVAEPITTRFAAVATGAVVDLAQRIGLVTDPEPSAIALRCYVRSPRRRDDTIISYDESILPGYGWIVPLGEDHGHPGAFLYNVGCGTMYRHVRDGRHMLKRTLHRFMERFPPAREIMAGAEIVSPIAGAALRCGLRGLATAHCGNVLAIGETIGATYPFTGEGIGKAMETGSLAAETLHEALAADDPSLLGRFSERLRELRPRYRGYAVAERYLGRRRLNDYVARRITRSRYLQRQVEAFMAETESPRRLFHPLSIILSYFC